MSYSHMQRTTFCNQDIRSPTLLESVQLGKDSRPAFGVGVRKALPESSLIDESQ